MGNMGTNNILLMIFSLIALAYGFAVIILNMTRDVKLHKRNNINYNNYKKYRKYYDFQLDIKVSIFNAVFFIYDIVMCFLIVNNINLVWYMIPLVITLIIVGITLYMFISSSKFNRDLSDFDNYYETIKTSYINKDLINDNIRRIGEKKTFIYKQIDSLNQECIKVFPSHVKMQNAEKCLEQINQVELEQKGFLGSFDDKTSKLFTKALKEYLDNKGKVDANSFIFSNDYAVDVDTLASDALAQLKQIFKEYIVTTYVNSNKSINEFKSVCECLNNFDDFNQYYEFIKESYNNRNSFSYNVNKLNDIRSEVSKNVDSLLSDIKKIFPNIGNITGTEKAYEEIDFYIQKNEELINKFEDAMLNLSEQLFNDYLANKTINKANYSLFNYANNIDFEAIKNNSNNTIKELFKNIVVTGFEKGVHRNAAELIKICECLYKINAFDSKYIEKLVQYIAVDPNGYDTAIDYIYQKNLVNYDLLIICNDKGYDWIYSRPINSFLNFNQLTQLMADILTKDLYKVANRYLLLCDKNDINYIKNAIAVANVKNDTNTLVENYISLLQLDGGFNMLSTRYENLALVLRYYFLNKDGKKNDIVESIITQEEFYENREYLDRTYSAEMISMEPVLMKTFKSLLYYSLYCAKDYDLLLEDRIKELYAEYKRTLNIKGLVCLSSLLDALMVINVKDNKALDVILQNLSVNKGVIYYDDYYPLTANKNKNYKMYGRDIIRNLIENHFGILSGVINHIEKDRLFIDKIRFA